MAITGLTPILNVSDVPASFAWFEALGWKRGFAWNQGGMIADAADSNEQGRAHFGSVCASWRAPNDHAHESQIFLCCNGQGSRGTIRPKFAGDDETDGVWMSWWLDSIASVDAMHALCVKHGFEVTMPPTNEPWGVREFHLRHPDGHMFRVSAGLTT
jgi:catechol 2,3-dioxygenase-like lactoylglutathione lyase family enzyme